MDGGVRPGEVDSTFPLHSKDLAMHRFLVVAATAAAFAIPATALAKDASLHLTHKWNVSLDASGKVTSLADHGTLVSAVREPLERAIRGWSFQPGKIDGKPAPTDTALTLDVTFLPTADGKYSVRIDDARTGGTIEAAKRMPIFPRDALRPGLIARVVVKADYDADGRIVAVEAQPDQGIHALRSLQAATVDAVRHWKVTPERVGGHGVASTVMVPVCYSVAIGNSRPPDFACTWTPPGSKSKIDDGGAFALAPTAKLATDVIGRAL